MVVSQNTAVTECHSSRIYVRVATTMTRLGGKALALDLVTILGFVHLAGLVAQAPMLMKH